MNGAWRNCKIAIVSIVGVPLVAISPQWSGYSMTSQCCLLLGEFVCLCDIVGVCWHWVRGRGVGWMQTICIPSWGETYVVHGFERLVVSITFVITHLSHWFIRVASHYKYPVRLLYSWRDQLSLLRCVLLELSYQNCLCTARESNPGRKNGNLAWYHYTSDATAFHQIFVENHKPLKLVWFSPALRHVWRFDFGIVPHRIFVLNKYSPASSVGRAWDS